MSNFDFEQLYTSINSEISNIISGDFHSGYQKQKNQFQDATYALDESKKTQTQVKIEELQRLKRERLKTDHKSTALHTKQHYINVSGQKTAGFVLSTVGFIF